MAFINHYIYSFIFVIRFLLLLLFYIISFVLNNKLYLSIYLSIYNLRIIYVYLYVILVTIRVDITSVSMVRRIIRTNIDEGVAIREKRTLKSDAVSYRQRFSKGKILHSLSISSTLKLEI